MFDSSVSKFGGKNTLGFLCNNVWKSEKEVAAAIDLDKAVQVVRYFLLIGFSN